MIKGHGGLNSARGSPVGLSTKLGSGKGEYSLEVLYTVAAEGKKLAENVDFHHECNCFFSLQVPHPCLSRFQGHWHDSLDQVEQCRLEIHKIRHFEHSLRDGR